MAEIKEAKVPDIGDFSAVPVIELLVAVGDSVRRDQGLVTLESDKATMEVPAPFDGVVTAVKVKVGDSVGEGAVVALIETSESGAGEESAPSAAPTDVQPEAPRADAKADAESAAEPPPATEAPAGSQAAPSAPATAPPPAGAGIDAEIAPPRTPPVEFGADAVAPDKVPHASPAVRAFARELGVDLGRVRGSARAGRITREDVQQFVKAALAGSGAPAASAGGGLNLLPWPNVDFARFGEIETQPMSRIKKLSGANLARNWAMIPHVTQHDEADVTEMEAFRKRLGEEHKDVKITPLVFLIKALVAGLKAFPNFNASLAADGESLVLKRYFHIGIAVDTPDGLVVPVLRDCDTKGVLELSRELSELSGKAREKKLKPAEMSGGCISITSLGGIGGNAFTPIINAPEVAILGVSRSALKPVWDGTAFVPRLLLPLSLSYDHRVIDGADAARFTTFLGRTLADIRRLLL